MARRRSTKQAKDRPNPYRHVADGELEQLYRDAVGAYIERLEYLEALPQFMRGDFRKMHEQGPERWGITRSEWDGYVLDLREHVVMSARLDDMREERARRLSDAAREAVESCSDLDAAQGKLALYGIPQGPVCPWKTDAETMEGYVWRLERHHDAWSEWIGANRGHDAFFDGWLTRRAERKSQGCCLL